MTDEPVDFELIAVTRDLARNPDIRFLAKVIQSIASTEPVADPAPIYVMLAHKIINRPGALSNLVHALEIAKR